MDYSSLPDFAPADLAQIKNEINAAYVAIVGKPLLPMQTEAIILQVMAQREKIWYDSLNEACRTQLLDFSKAPMLDFLVALVNVTRLSAQFATTTLEFNIIHGHTGVTIPALTRVQSSDGKVAFATVATTFIPAGTYVVDIQANAQTVGVIGNDYVIGSINNILDPLVFVISASNIDVSAGGADQESDEQLISRTKDKPDSYSNAGPVGAYRYFAKSAHPSIVDVAVMGHDDDISFDPGSVHLFPLIKGGGVTPGPILALVLAACNADEVVPINDLVIVASPTAVDYAINVNLTLFDSANDSAVNDIVNQLLNDYSQSLKGKLAVDVIVAEITAISMQPGVYNAAVILPVADVTLLKNQYANITGITTNIVGHHAG